MPEFDIQNTFDGLPPEATSVTARLILSKEGRTVESSVTRLISDPGEDNFLPLSDLEDLIDAAEPNSIIDLAGEGYAPQTIEEADSYPTGIQISKNITLKNGTVTGTMRLNWTEVDSSGLFFADLPVSSNEKITYDDPRIYLIDDDQDEVPYLQARRPESREEFKRWNGLSVNERWYFLTREDGVPTTDFGFGTHGTYTVTNPGGTEADFATSVRADPSVKDEWDSFFANGPNETTTLIHGYPNVITTVSNASYDSSTGVLTFEAPTEGRADKYLNVSFTGLDPNTFLESGEFCIRRAENRIYYRPVNGNPNSSRVPVMSKIFRLSDLQTLTLDNMELFGQLQGTDSSPGIISSNSGENAGILKTQNNTIIRHGAACCFGIRIDLEDSSFYEFTLRFGSGLSSGRALRNYFGNAANKSILYFGYSTTENPILIKDNFFDLPATAHGQPISLYQESWQNATIEHNLFYNSERVLSFQPSSGNDGDESNVGTFRFANNLIYIDTLRNSSLKSGQSGFAFNGGEAPALDGLGQKVIILNNTFAVSAALVDTNSTTNVFQQIDLSLNKLQHSEVLTANNVYARRRIPSQSDYDLTTEDGHGSLSNLDFGNLAFQSGYAATDVLNIGYDGVFDPNTLRPIGDLTTAATDGGAIGIRWESIPDPENIKTLDRTWASNHRELPLPTVNFPTDPNSIIVADDDKR